MRLKTARLRNYRSIRDTGPFEVEQLKTILVGPNEAGKSAILQALQQLNPPEGVKGFDALRDYPRALYNDIKTGKVDPKTTSVVIGVFELEDADRQAIPDAFRGCSYQFTKYLANNSSHILIDAPAAPAFSAIQKDLLRLAAHADARLPAPAEGAEPKPAPTEKLNKITNEWKPSDLIADAFATSLKEWLKSVTPLIDEHDETEQRRLDDLVASVGLADEHAAVLATLYKRLPVFVLYGNYFRVRPIIHLKHLADRLDTGVLDDEQYDYGNSCLLKLLGFTARELSALGAAEEPAANNPEALKKFRDQLDARSYQLNAASVRLTQEIRQVWNPNPEKPEADKVLVRADGQYLKVVVEDDLGVEIELDQRSEGFQWLVSFFIVFFAEAADKNERAILLLDEPGLSLHGLKQRDFRLTVSRLAESNQTIYTTHSPFLVGPDELDMVRVVEMTDRRIGTKVHTSITSTDPAALLPLQEALGYDLAQSLFAQQRNLILEGLTDYWYLESVAALLTDAGSVKLNDKIALVPAKTAGKVVYFATILHSNKLKVATLLDSDNAGDQAAQQEVLVHTLGNKRILRTGDYVSGIEHAEIEDMLRDTLPVIANKEFGWDIGAELNAGAATPLIDLFERKHADFSKYRLAKAFIRWTRDHNAKDLSANEQQKWAALITSINSVLK